MPAAARLPIQFGATLSWWWLGRELRAWRRLGQRPRLWLRDDDAQRPDPRLDRLLDLTRRHAVPLVLAVIPEGDLAPLAARLAGEAHVEVMQHGIDHVNRRPAGQGAAEFPDGQPVEEVAAAIATARAALFGAFPRALPAYAPPWNALQDNVAAGLAQLQVAAVSADGAPAGFCGPLRRYDVHVDLMRWNPSPHGRKVSSLVGILARQLRQRRLARLFDDPVGLMTHHLQHDEAAWTRLAELFVALREADWHRFSALLPAPVATP